IAKSDRVILAGDHLQLPPTIKCIEAERAGLSVTLMQKLMQSKNNISTLLTTQYRMHQDIMEFSSSVFYDGKLTAAPEVRYRSILSWDTPLVWIDTKGGDYKESTLSKGKSLINRSEAALLISQLTNYVENIGKERIIHEQIDFGIISPYKAQAHYLRHLIKKNSFLRSIRKRISINTVDGFQGQERDVILISLVRTNQSGKIGFLSDLRRLNVAITRAKMKLFILGNSETLCNNKFFKYFYEYIEDRGEIIEIDNSPSKDESAIDN
ncbi:MAG: DEAD/DEAH box helicase family protein, partial [Bacteroidales bacterium]